MIVALTFVAIATSAQGDSAEAAVRSAISRFHARELSAGEFLAEIQRTRFGSPPGKALQSLLKLATDKDPLLALPADVALLDQGSNWSEEEFIGTDAAWRAYVTDDRWYAASRGTPLVTTSNELMTRREPEPLDTMVQEAKLKAFDADPTVRRRSLAPLLKLDPFVDATDPLLAKLPKSNDPLVRVSEIQFGQMTHGSARPPTKLEVRRKEFVDPIRQCLASDDWLAVQQGLRWGAQVLENGDFQTEVEQLLRHPKLAIRVRTARFLDENEQVASNLVDVVREGLNSPDPLDRCGALVVLRSLESESTKVTKELYSALADRNAVVSGVAGATVWLNQKILMESIRVWSRDPDPRTRRAVLSIADIPSIVSHFLEHRRFGRSFDFDAVVAVDDWLRLAEVGVNDVDPHVRIAAVDLVDRFCKAPANQKAEFQLRALVESKDHVVADRALNRLIKHWTLVAELPPKLQDKALDRVTANFRSSDWTTYCDARVVLVNLPELTMPRLMPLLESKESVPLRNKLILEHYPFETETGTCFSSYFIPYELDRIAGRAAHLVQMLSDHDFGFHFQKVWNVRDKNANPDGAHETLDEDLPSRKKERDERFSSAVEQAKAWWKKSGATYTRLSTLVESLKSSDIDRKRRALEYLVEGGAVCHGLNDQVWKRDIRPAVERLRESKDNYVRNASNHLIEDENLEWLKIKTGAIWTVR